ncbi:alpha/beta hydrolase [Nonomuraea sp. FMUSA5-5]|uniref:Alpha/beta hydrolase n=1 Tax=Nonomuraea composti TaxID=2720023 RepID=A0ABX1BPJ5_9ACTN|nr:alpha/beta hydrolase [Nonomuraea sp. FMUSA5-5]NJP97083.1 alpha/beta hydrolase [Nonomuraea sp. FMUSA5-5]
MIISYPIRSMGIRSRIVEAGTGPQEIWLVHGIGGRADRWRSCLEPLAQAGYRVRAVDLPGHGFASRSAEARYTVAGFAAFMAETLARYAEGESITLIGTSFGGHVALRTALDLHTEVDTSPLHALVLCAPTGICALGSEAREGLADRLAQPDRETVRSRLSFMTGMTGSDLDVLTEEEYRITNFPGTVHAMQRLAAMVREELDAQPLLDSLVRLAWELPVLQVWGEADRSISPEIGRRIARHVPAISSVLLPGVGHMPYLQAPELFHREVLGFLRQIC